MNLNFDQLKVILDSNIELYDQNISIISNYSDFSNDILKINSPISVSFNFENEIICKNIIITNCSVTFKNLNLKGSITVDRGTLRLYNSKIHDILDNSDYLLSCSDISTVECYDCIFENSKKFGINSDSGSTLLLENCILRNINYYGISISSYSILNCIKTIFSNIKNDILFIDQHCTILIKNCNFENSFKNAIVINNYSILKFDNSSIKNCLLGCISVMNCDQIFISYSSFTDCNHTAIYSNKSILIIKHTLISNCNGNGINSHNFSKLMVTNSYIRSTVCPPISICDNSFAYIKKCGISNSQMNGIIIRNDSKSVIESCFIENITIHGICISESKNISINKCIISNVGHSCISCYNFSSLQINNCYLIGPSLYGINIHTGGLVSSFEVTIIGMLKSAIWLHHGGSGKFISTLMDCKPIIDSKNILNVIESINLFNNNNNILINPNKIMKIETSRTVICFKGFVIGSGLYELILNDFNEIPNDQNFISSPSNCEICDKIANNCYFSPCGHSIYCKDCWNNLENKPKTCYLCQSNIEKICEPIDCSTVNDIPNTCGICMESPSDSIIVPCGHLICSKCSDSWFLNSFDCPFCREPNSKPRKFVIYQ